MSGNPEIYREQLAKAKEDLATLLASGATADSIPVQLLRSRIKRLEFYLKQAGKNVIKTATTN